MKKYFEKNLPLIENEIEKLVPEKIDKKWLKKNIDESMDHDIGVNFSFDYAVWVKSLAAPMKDILKHGGKRLRPLMTLLINDIFGGHDPEVYRMAAISELIHNATLIIDDIEDSSVLRRGEKCAYLKYGTGVAVNCGNFYYFYPANLIPNLKCSQNQKMDLYQIFIDKMVKLHVGQAMDIQWANNSEIFEVTEEEYLQMCAYKTGGLLSIAMQFGAVAAKINAAIFARLDKMAIKMGIAYQIKDDILNISENSEWGKEFGEDVTESKLTLPVILAIKMSDSTAKNKLVKILQNKTTNKTEIIEAVDIMINCGAIQEAEKKAFNLIADCKCELASDFPQNKYTKIFDEILDYMIDRKK